MSEGRRPEVISRLAAAARLGAGRPAPEEAAAGIVRDALQLPGFAPGRILERLLRSP